jgi:hypothetical protein
VILGLIFNAEFLDQKLKVERLIVKVLGGIGVW